MPDSPHFHRVRAESEDKNAEADEHPIEWQVFLWRIKQIAVIGMEK
jgi:hypothetical protein